MTITLTKDATVLDLADDLIWTDEFAFNHVAAASRYGITGALIIDSGLKQAGRSITLTGGDDWAWMPRSTLLTLEAWKQLPGQQFVLTINGVAHTVVMDHERGAVDAKLVIDYADPDADDNYSATLRFLKVA